MPKSKVRKKSAYTPPADRRITMTKATAPGPSHPVYVAVMLGVMLLGLAWLVVNYLAGEKIPLLNGLGNYNFLIGFALMIVGLLMTMRWR
ncbi:MAG: cell division protein CrgA [Pseudonocardiaceae bacterium]